MERANVRAEQRPFPCVQEQSDPVSQVGFQFQRQCAAVDEAVFIREHSPVRQQLVAPVAGLIPGKSRQAQREEKGLAPVREEFQVIAALRRELFHRNAHLLVLILLVQVFSANHPAVGVLGIDAVRRPDVVGEIRVIVPMYPVRHARRNLQALHARQVSLRSCLVEMQAQRKECHYKDKFLHRLFDFEFVYLLGVHDVCVFHPDGLMPTAVLLVEFHHQQLVVRDGEFRQGVHRTHRAFPGNLHHFVVAPDRIDDRFLNGGSLGHFLIDNLKPDEVRVERHGGTVLRLRMHVQHPVVGVNALYQELDAETLAAQMPYLPVVLLVDALHYELHQERTFVAEFPEIDVHPCMRKVGRIFIFQKLLHFDVEHFRLTGILGVKGIETSVLADDGEVRFARKPFGRGFHPDDVLRTVRLARYDMVASQIHIAHGGWENDMHCLGEGNFHAVGRYHLPVREFPGNALVQVVAVYKFLVKSLFLFLKQAFTNIYYIYSLTSSLDGDDISVCSSLS